MTRYLLDTNIISNVVKAQPSARLIAWLETRTDQSLHVASLTVAEIRRGILALPQGRRRLALEMWFVGPEGPFSLFAGRVLPFDSEAAMRWAELMTERRAAGLAHDPLDMIVASVALHHRCVIVTDNERDFVGLEIVNPLKG